MRAEAKVDSPRLLHAHLYLLEIRHGTDLELQQ